MGNNAEDDVNRDQCKAILANLDLIRHFADNGDIGHRAPNCRGEIMPISIAKGIGLGGIKPDGSTFYLRLKPKYKFNNHTQKMERVMRHWPEVPTENDVIYCKD
jgi:hypothetical protein